MTSTTTISSIDFRLIIEFIGSVILVILGMLLTWWLSNRDRKDSQNIADKEMRIRSLLETRNHIRKVQEKLQHAIRQMIESDRASETKEVLSMLRRHPPAHNFEGTPKERTEHGRKTALIFIDLLKSMHNDLSITAGEYHVVVAISAEANECIVDPAFKRELAEVGVNTAVILLTVVPILDKIGDTIVKSEVKLFHTNNKSDEDFPLTLILEMSECIESTKMRSKKADDDFSEYRNRLDLVLAAALKKVNEQILTEQKSDGESVLMTAMITPSAQRSAREETA